MRSPRPDKPRTLRNRVLWLFATLALAPFLLASLVQYRQAAADADRAAAAVAESVSAGALAKIERIRGLAEADALSYVNWLSEPEGASDWIPRFSTFVRRIEVIGANAEPRGAWQNPNSPERAVCSSSENAGFAFTVNATVSDSGERVVVRVVPDISSAVRVDVYQGPLAAASWIRVLGRDDAYITTSGCPGAEMSVIPTFAAGVAGPDDAVFWRERVPEGSALRVQAAVSRELLGIHNGDAWWFFAVAALTALIATLLFRLFLSGFTRSIEQLALAADRIGEGDFSPWLPPPGNDEAGRLSYAIGRMVDRIREMLEKVKRSGQMAAVGEMASHVAHEIRNPLNSLRLNLQSVQRSAIRGTLEADDLESMETCLREVTRLDRVVSGVLRLTKPSPAHVELTSLHAVVRQVVGLLEEELTARSVTTVVDLSAGDDWIHADAQQIEAALLNLALNCVEAMPAGGQITISTRGTGLSGQPAVELRVSDTGPGVPVELRSRIFDPFFTTKAFGSGLGLAVVMKTVEGHGGHMELVDPSTLDRGATFRIVFPTAVTTSVLRPAVHRWGLTERVRRKLFAWKNTSQEEQMAHPIASRKPGR